MFPQKEYIFIQNLAPCHDSTSTRTFPECKGIPILEWPGNSLDMNPNEYNNEIGNQMPCKKGKMWKRVYKAWYSVKLNVLEEPYNAIPRRIADLIKANGDASIY